MLKCFSRKRKQHMVKSRQHEDGQNPSSALKNQREMGKIEYCRDDLQDFVPRSTTHTMSEPCIL